MLMAFKYVSNCLQQGGVFFAVLDKYMETAVTEIENITYSAMFMLHAQHAALTVPSKAAAPDAAIPVS